MIDKLNARSKFFLMLALSVGSIMIIILLGLFLSNDGLLTNGSLKSMPPSLKHPFGTDWLGRDMFTRTLKGLRLSLVVGFVGAFVGAVLAFILGVVAAMFGKKADAAVSWLVDLCIGMPHLVFIVLVSFMVGGGVKGVILGVGLTHWPALTRILRNEVLCIKDSEYIRIARNLGKSRLRIIAGHILPHVLPQLMVGFLLLFPHAIIHESAITFLGFGLPVQTPSIGLILSEAVKHISIGDWWLAVFPGVLLVLVVKGFDTIGEQCRSLQAPGSANQ